MLQSDWLRGLELLLDVSGYAKLLGLNSASVGIDYGSHAQSPVYGPESVHISNILTKSFPPVLH